MAKITRPQNSYLAPKNDRLVSVGQRNLIALQHNNRANVTNAIKATGYPITLYNTLLAGRPCTCTRVQQPEKGSAILNDDGKLGEDEMRALLVPNSSGLLDYGSPLPNTTASVAQTRLTSTGGPREITLSDTQDRSRMTLGPIQIDQPFSAETQEDLDFLDAVNALEGSAATQYLNEQLTPERFLTSADRACAVCFGTGYVGGYELVHGIRLCLHNQYASLENVVVDTLKAPNAFNFITSQGGSITYRVTIPRGSCYALYPRLFNNTKAIPYAKWRIKLGGTVLRTPQQLMQLADGKPKDIVLEVDAGNTCTHLELLYSGLPLDQPLKADSPEISRITDVTRMDPKTPVTYILGGTFNISKRAIIIDHLPRLSRRWRANDIQERRDNYGFLYEQTLSCRVVDLMEITQLLRPVRPERTPFD